MADKSTATPYEDGSAGPGTNITRPQPVAQVNPPSSIPQFAPVRLDPPPDIQRPKRTLARQLRMGGTEYVFSSPYRWTRRDSCARQKYCHRSNFARHAHEDGSKPYIERIRESPGSGMDIGKVPYIVVGIMGNHHNVPRETLIEVTAPESLFRCIRRASKKVRPLYRRFLSLKYVAGFGMYMCLPDKGYHSTVEMDRQTEQVLNNMYDQFQTGEPDYGNRWLDWIQTEFNNRSLNPADGTYSLQLLLRWSPLKVVFWGIAAIIFSLVIGFWYQWRDYPWAGPADHVSIVQTAWTISSYILTAAGVGIALLAAVTQTGDI